MQTIPERPSDTEVVDQLVAELQAHGKSDTLDQWYQQISAGISKARASGAATPDQLRAIEDGFAAVTSAVDAIAASVQRSRGGATSASS
jgi:hypothetical protein